MPAWVGHRGCHWLQWKVYANPCTCPPCMPATLQHACSRAAQFLMRGSAGSHHVLLCRAARSHGLNPKGQHERLPNLSSNPSQNFKKPAVTPWPNAIAKPSLHSTQGQRWLPGPHFQNWIETPRYLHCWFLRTVSVWVQAWLWMPSCSLWCRSLWSRCTSAPVCLCPPCAWEHMATCMNV